MAGVFLVVVALVVAATLASALAWSGVGLIAFVPLVGLAVFPLQLAALLVRGLAFEYLGLTALGAYLTLYQTYALTARGRAVASERRDAAGSTAERGVRIRADLRPLRPRRHRSKRRRSARSATRFGSGADAASTAGSKLRAASVALTPLRDVARHHHDQRLLRPRLLERVRRRGELSASVTARRPASRPSCRRRAVVAVRPETTIGRAGP